MRSAPKHVNYISDQIKSQPWERTFIWTVCTACLQVIQINTASVLQVLYKWLASRKVLIRLHVSQSYHFSIIGLTHNGHVGNFPLCAAVVAHVSKHSTWYLCRHLGSLYNQSPSFQSSKQIAHKESMSPSN